MLGLRTHNFEKKPPTRATSFALYISHTFHYPVGDAALSVPPFQSLSFFAFPLQEGTARLEYACKHKACTAIVRSAT